MHKKYQVGGYMNNDNINNSELESLNLNEQQGSVPHPEPQAIFTGPPPQQPPKKSKKGLIIILSVVFLLAIAGVVAYLFFSQQKNDAANTTPTNQTEAQTTPADTTDYAKVLIDKVQTAEKALVSKFPGVKAETTDATAPAYKYESNEYYISGSFGYSIVVTNTAPANATNTAAFPATSLETATKTLSSDPSLRKNETEATITYKSDLVTCSLPKASTPLYISCANTRDYAKLAADVKPFADALFIAQGNEGKSSVILSAPKVTEKADGYANAQVSVGVYEGVGGYAALFYSKDANWIFWKGTQSQIACSAYDTFALQTSFLGDTCYDEATKAESTVKLPS